MDMTKNERQDRKLENDISSGEWFQSGVHGLACAELHRQNKLERKPSPMHMQGMWLYRAKH